MAHFAELDETNTVLRVIVMDNDWVDANGGDYSDQAANRIGKMLKSENKTWKQTSYNSRSGVYHSVAGDGSHVPAADQSKLKRHTFASEGATYDPVNDVFIYPQPYASWVLDNFNWVPPITEPAPIGDATLFFIEWDEDNVRWTGKSSPDGEIPMKDWVWNTGTNVWDEVIS